MEPMTELPKKVSIKTLGKVGRNNSITRKVVYTCNNTGCLPHYIDPKEDQAYRETREKYLPQENQKN